MVEPVVWSPGVDPGVVILAPAPSSLPDAPTDQALPVLELSHVREAPEAVYAFTTIVPPIPLVLPPGMTAATGLGVFVPPDSDDFERIDAIVRFLHVRRGSPAPLDLRLTIAQRRRLIFILRALDGATQGATHREIAEALLGRARLDSEAWQVSSHRDWIKRLLRDGRRLVRGGYLELLRRHRRR